MFPTISDLINYIFGTNIFLPIQTYGFFMALSILMGMYILKRELIRMEKEKLLLPEKKTIIKGLPASKWELISTAIFSLLIGYKFAGIVVDYQEFSNNTQEYILSGKGNWIGGIIVSAFFTIYTYYKKNKSKLAEPIKEEIDVYPHELSGTILVLAAVSGILGSKIFHNLENFSDLIANPVEALTSFMGLTFYGGLILATATVLFYAHRHKINLLHLLDASAPGIIVGYGIGRIGCMASGDGCWGIVNTHPKPSWLNFLPDWMWSFKFPHNVVNDGITLDNCTGKYCTILPEGVYPTSFYDTVICLLIFIILWSIRKKIKIPGVLFSIMMIFMGIQRFFMEKIRVNNKYNLFNIEFTQGELISIIFILLGITGIFIFNHLNNKNRKVEV